MSAAFDYFDYENSQIVCKTGLYKETNKADYDSLWYNQPDITTIGYKNQKSILKNTLEYAADATSAATWNEYFPTYLTETTAAATYNNNHIHWSTYYDNKCLWIPPVVAPGDRLRQIIQTRMAPVFHRSRTSMSIAMDVREERARQTLRRIIGDQAYRKFMRNGFITVVPKSGLTYRIYPGCGITDVYDRGIMVDRLCVVLEGNFPPTDSLLMRYLLILNDEGEFSKYAIKHRVSQGIKKLVFPDQEVKPLTEAWAGLKVA